MVQASPWERKMKTQQIENIMNNIYVNEPIWKFCNTRNNYDDGIW